MPRVEIYVEDTNGNRVTSAEDVKRDEGGFLIGYGIKVKLDGQELKNIRDLTLEFPPDDVAMLKAEVFIEHPIQLDLPAHVDVHVVPLAVGESLTTITSDEHGTHVFMHRDPFNAEHMRRYLNEPFLHQLVHQLQTHAEHHKYSMNDLVLAALMARHKHVLEQEKKQWQKDARTRLDKSASPLSDQWVCGVCSQAAQESHDAKVEPGWESGEIIITHAMDESCPITGKTFAENSDIGR